MKVTFNERNVSRLELIKQAAMKMMDAKRDERRAAREAIRELEVARREYISCRMRAFLESEG